jgi:hypothetical protein
MMKYATYQNQQTKFFDSSNQGDFKDETHDYFHPTTKIFYPFLIGSDAIDDYSEAPVGISAQVL